MSKSNEQNARKIWQPLNRQSQVAATITVAILAAFQLYSWQLRSMLPPSAQGQTAQQLPASKK